MKRLFTIALALVFLSPVCEGGFANASMDMSPASHAEMNADSMSHEEMPSVSDIKNTTETSACEDQNPKSDSSGMDCCNTDAAHAKIGIWISGPTEKIIKSVVTVFQSPFAYQEIVLPGILKNHYSTAPPENRQSYANLVGIIKRLN